MQARAPRADFRLEEEKHTSRGGCVRAVNCKLLISESTKTPRRKRNWFCIARSFFRRPPTRTRFTGRRGDKHWTHQKELTANENTNTQQKTLGKMSNSFTPKNTYIFFAIVFVLRFCPTLRKNQLWISFVLFSSFFS